MRPMLFAFFGAAALAAAMPGRAAAITLVQDGQPRAAIVVTKAALAAAPDLKPADVQSPLPADRKVAAAAHDLQTYLQKITGAKLPVVADDKVPAGPVVLVGKSALARPEDRIPAGATPVCEEEGFVLLGKGDRLLLAGNDDGPYHGTEYAVAELLERLGVRWFMPGDYGEVVPHQPTVTVANLEVRQQPDFKMRNWWGALATDQMRLDEYRWKVRNKMNPVLHFITLPGDSSFRALSTPDMLKAHPELFGQTPDGKPDPGMPNLSNPKAPAAFAAVIAEQFRKNPAQTSLGFAPDDGLPRDWRPESLALNRGFPDVVGRLGVPAEASISEEWFTFVNAVAREVHKQFPNHILTTNGYANRNTPPVGMGVEKNVWIMFAAIWADTLHAYDNPRSWQAVREGQMVRRWAELCPNVFMYDYTYIMLASAGTPVPLARKHLHDMPLLKKWGVIGFADEGRRVLGEAGIAPPYLRAKLMWNAHLDGPAVLDDFFTKWYGGAARPARAFWDALEEAMEKTPMVGHEDRVLPYVYTPELVAELGRDVAEAERLADGDTARAHVKADRLILEHLRGYLAMTEAEWACNFPEAVKQADHMLAQRQQLSALSPFYFTADDAKPDSGFYYWGVVARRAYYQKLADQTTGKTGDLVAVLPETARFRTDPNDEGRFAGWFAPDRDDRDWRPLRTTVPFYAQGYRDEHGYPYLGAMWYRFTVDVPASARGKKVHLYAPAVETEAWGWVNGQYVGHRPYHEAYERPNEIDWDVTAALQPGKTNTVVLRVHTGMGASGQASGLISRVFLYAPR